MALYRNIRLDRAYQLLKQTDMNVRDICVATGFSSSSSFSVRFRDRFGKPPREIRKQRFQGDPC